MRGCLTLPTIGLRVVQFVFALWRRRRLLRGLIGGRDERLCLDRKLRSAALDQKIRRVRTGAFGALHARNSFAGDVGRR
jgi:hypothetical protein